MSNVGLLWVFASVVILVAQCVIVWKAHAIFRAVVDSETAQQGRVVKRVEELFAEQRARPPFDVSALLDKLQGTYLEHLDAVRHKHEERFEQLAQERRAVHEAELRARDTQLRILSEESRRLRALCPPQLLAAAEVAAGADEEQGDHPRSYHAFWIGRALAWAMAVDPVAGLERALAHLRATGLAREQGEGEDETLEDVAEACLTRARELSNGDLAARSALNVALVKLHERVAVALS